MAEGQTVTLSARKRIERLLDPGSFAEIGKNVQAAGGGPEAVITGSGAIDGQQVFVFAQDCAVDHGSMSGMHARKIKRVFDMALQSGTPVVGIYDSMGARLNEGIMALQAYGSLLARHATRSGVIPQIALVLGPCVGSASFAPALSDLVVVGGKGALLLAGKQVVAARTGQAIEGIGGAKDVKASGLAHIACEREEDAIDAVRGLMKYLPGNNLEDAPSAEPLSGGAADADAAVADLAAAVFDRGSLIELHEGFGKSSLVGFAHCDGRPVGVVGASGELHESDCDKIARFVRLCDAFSLPIVTLLDSAGFAVDAHHADLVRAGARLVYAYAEATAAKVTVVTHEAVGAAYVALGSRALGADICYAWPKATISALPLEAAGRVFGASSIAKDGNIASAVAEYTEKYASAQAVEESGLIDGVIEPMQTRGAIIQALSMLEGKREHRPAKKHGNLPL